MSSLTSIFSGAAATSGHAALLFEIFAKWMRQAAAKGLAFHALVGEDSGRLGVGPICFVNFLASHARFLGGGATHSRIFHL